MGTGQSTLAIIAEAKSSQNSIDEKNVGAAGPLNLQRRSSFSLRKKSTSGDLAEKERKKFSTVSKAIHNPYSPTGTVSRDIINTQYSMFLTAKELFNNLFRVMDAKKDGKLDFEEYIVVCGIITRGTLDQQLELTFELFDLDGDRHVTKDEVKTVVENIGTFLEVVSRGLYPGEELHRLDEDVAREIFHDEDELLLDVFKKRSMNNNAILSCLGIFDFLFAHIVRTMEKEMGTKRLFGRSLTEVLRIEKREIPVIIEKTTMFLESKCLDVEGIFRVSGDFVEMRKLKSEFDQGKDVEFSSSQSPHIVAGLLKRFLNDLPEPLLTFAYHDSFEEIDDITDENEKINSTSALLKSLPVSHLNLLNFLVTFLKKVGENCEKNLMTLNNLAVVFAPSFLRPKVETHESMAACDVYKRVVLYLLINWNKIYSEQGDLRNLNVKSLFMMVNLLKKENRATLKLKDLEIQRLKSEMKSRDALISKLESDIESLSLARSIDATRRELHLISTQKIQNEKEFEKKV